MEAQRDLRHLGKAPQPGGAGLGLRPGRLTPRPVLFGACPRPSSGVLSVSSAVPGGGCSLGPHRVRCGAGLAHLPSEGPAAGPWRGLHPGLPGALRLRRRAGDQQRPGRAAGPRPRPAGPRPAQVGAGWEGAQAPRLPRAPVGALRISSASPSSFSRVPHSTLPRGGGSQPRKLTSSLGKPKPQAPRGAHMAPAAQRGHRRASLLRLLGKRGAGGH